MEKNQNNKDKWDMQGAPPSTVGFSFPSSGIPSMSGVPNSSSSSSSSSSMSVVPSGSGVPSGMGGMGSGMTGMGSGAVTSGMDGMGSGAVTSGMDGMGSGVGSSEPSNSLRKFSFDATKDPGGWGSSLINDPMKDSYLDVPNNTGNDDINFGEQSILSTDNMVNRYEMANLFVEEGDEKAGNLPPSGSEWQSILKDPQIKDDDVDMEELGGGGRRRRRKKRTRRIKKKGGVKGKRPDTPPSRTRHPNRRQPRVASSINRSAPSITRRLNYRRPLPRTYAITNPIGDSESTMRIRSLDQMRANEHRRQRRRDRLGIARTRRSLNEAIDDENVKQENVADPPPQEPSFNKENQGGPGGSGGSGGSGSGGISAGGRRRRTKRRKKRRSRRTRKHRKKGTRRSRKKRRKSRRR
jgi:hypothetical protein